MNCASNFVYFKKKKEKDEEKDDGYLSCSSDELNKSFDSDEEDNYSKDFMFMDVEHKNETFGGMNAAPEKEVKLSKKKKRKAKKSEKSGGIFGGLGSMSRAKRMVTFKKES